MHPLSLGRHSSFAPRPSRGPCDENAGYRVLVSIRRSRRGRTRLYGSARSVLAIHHYSDFTESPPGRCPRSAAGRAPRGMRGPPYDVFRRACELCCHTESENRRRYLPGKPGSRADVLDIPRKEVIQPQVLLRLPCYDLVPVTGLTVVASVLAVRSTTLGTPGSHGLTGGVYKAQEHIHRGIADPRLLAIPASCRRIAAYNPN